MKTVMIFGTFDIVHCGHIHMFKQAREYGDKLVVMVATDKNAEKVKKIGPLHNQEERKSFLQHIDLVDEAKIGDEDDPYKCIEEVRPDVIALGYDQKVFVDELEDKLTEFGLEAQIVRLRPYRENEFKSKKIRKYIERVI